MNKLQGALIVVFIALCCVFALYRPYNTGDSALIGGITYSWHKLPPPEDPSDLNTLNPYIMQTEYVSLIITWVLLVYCVRSRRTKLQAVSGVFTVVVTAALICFCQPFPESMLGVVVWHWIPWASGVILAINVAADLINVLRSRRRAPG